MLQMMMCVPRQLPQQPKPPPPLLTMALVTATKSADLSILAHLQQATPPCPWAQSGLKKLAARGQQSRSKEPLKALAANRGSTSSG